MKNTMLLLLLGLFAGGCASTSQFVPTTSQAAMADDKVLVKVTRNNVLYGAARGITVIDNEQPIGKVGPGGSLSWERSPGKLALKLKPSFGMVREIPPLVTMTERGDVEEFLVEFSMTQQSFIIRPLHYSANAFANAAGVSLP